jgi:predicted ATPase
VSVEGEGGGRLALRLHQHGLLRPLGAAELSDGTLRYLLWAAALLAPARRDSWCSTSRRRACTGSCWRRWPT